MFIKIAVIFAVFLLITVVECNRHDSELTKETKVKRVNNAIDELLEKKVDLMNDEAENEIMSDEEKPEKTNKDSSFVSDSELSTCVNSGDYGCDSYSVDYTMKCNCDD